MISDYESVFEESHVGTLCTNKQTERRTQRIEYEAKTRPRCLASSAITEADNDKWRTRNFIAQRKNRYSWENRLIFEFLTTRRRLVPYVVDEVGESVMLIAFTTSVCLASEYSALRLVHLLPDHLNTTILTPNAHQKARLMLGQLPSELKTLRAHIKRMERPPRRFSLLE
uniref:AlNc14C611G12242 protein n=1 Tax=Albugo laibachii Nc14 TaxID=890382 RepID=F0X1F1_9STRA|nr:AlNc14C611G12242 [Albugo laibachii Nc14]|eukprot:CCA27629.1 AlNc14C611G12242 [Albugo laibachii Nc14]